MCPSGRQTCRALGGQPARKVPPHPPQSRARRRPHLRPHRQTLLYHIIQIPQHGHRLHHPNGQNLFRPRKSKNHPPTRRRRNPHLAPHPTRLRLLLSLLPTLTTALFHHSPFKIHHSTPSAAPDFPPPPPDPPPLPDIPTFLRILEYCPARHAGAPRPVEPGRRGLAAPLTVAGPLLLLPQAVI